jgi:uncharacterized membrane protein YdbT with pleckstrin-like domain
MMMSDYIRQSLASGENICVRGQWPGIYWFGAWCVLLLLGVFIVGIFWFAYLAMKMWTTRWAVTDYRVVSKKGWFVRDTAELSIDSIETVSVHQSFWGRMFNYGELVVTGAGESSLTLPPTNNPVAFRRAIESARVAARGVDANAAIA